jgi:hypothetical protein
MHSPLTGSDHPITRFDRLDRVERRLAGLVLALAAAKRPAEKMAAENILDDLRATRALGRMSRVA